MDGNDTPLIFAVLVVASTIGVFLNYAVIVLENILLPWQRKSL